MWPSLKIPFVLKDFANVFLFDVQVLKQLPAKEEEVKFCQMSEKQLVLYQNLFKKLKTSVNGESKSLPTTPAHC